VRSTVTTEDDYKTLTVRGTNGCPPVQVKLDTPDYDWLSQWSWQLHKPDGYARRTIRRGKRHYGTLFMHRLILGLSTDDKREVDHINGDTLDNRRCNLRIVTRAQNMQNAHKAQGNSTVGLRGVERHYDKYAARVALNGKRIHLGRYSTPEEAANVVLEWKKENSPYFAAS